METQQQGVEAVEGLVRRAVELEAAHRPEQALECLSEVVRLMPEHPVANLHLAAVMTEMGQFDEAVAPLRKALDARPDNAAFHLMAGRVQFDRMDHAAARVELARALSLSPGNDLARALAFLNDWEDGDADAPRKLDPDNLPDSDVFMARLLMLIERELKGRDIHYEDANRAVPLLDGPRIGWALWRAAGAMKEADFGRAGDEAQAVLEMLPGHPAAARILEESRRGALEGARRAAAEQPQSAQAHLELAQHLRDAEEYAAAAYELAEACRLFAAEGHPEEGNSPDVIRLEGMILYGLGCPAEALERLNAGAEPGFSMPITRYFQGLCHLALGRRMESLEAFAALVAKAWWAVPLRFREYLAWRARPAEART